MGSITPEEKRLQLLLKHISYVESDCRMLGQALLERGEDFNFVKNLLHNGHIHDASKFNGIEWEHLNGWDDPLFGEAIRHHVTTNSHHPEYWGSIHNMDRLAIAEMVCDWHARSAELRGKGLCQWIYEDAMSRYRFDQNSKVWTQIDEFVNLLLEPAFSLSNI